jgi:translation initiation factor 5B
MTEIRQPIVTVAGHVDHGKCVSGDTIIPLIDGTLIRAKDLFDKYYNKNEAKKDEGDIIQKVNDVTLFSNCGAVILPTKVSHIWKRKKQKLIEIKTSHGDTLKTTPEHPYFTFSLDNKVKTRAENLKEGDYIAIPKQIKLIDLDPREIILQNLEENNFLLFLNLNSKELIEKIRKTGIKNIEKKLTIKNLGDSLKKERIRSKDFFKIGGYYNISKIGLINMIEAIKNSSEKQRSGHTSKVIKFPDFHNLEKLGYILGCIAGDGHLSKTQVLLDNNDLDIQEKYSEYLKEIFNLDCFVKQNHTCQTIVNNGGLSFKKFIKDIIGIPDKQKSATIEVPKIAQCNHEVFKGFFAGLLDTDGYVSHINHSIEITSKSKNLIKQCSILLLNFGIQSTLFEKNGFYNLRISNKKYLDKFLENIRPRLKRKLKRIITASEKAQSSRIFDIFPINKEEINKLKLSSNMNKKVPYFNKYLKNQRLTESFLLKVLDNLKEENATSIKIRRLLESDVRYVRVISKKEIKNKDNYVYDFTVPNTQNFIAERTILHNTSILDSIRKTCVQEGEAGGITQKISFTLFPKENIIKRCPLMEKAGVKVEIPGFLFIDTPGHAAFSNLRKRGGALADLAILVIDINEGIKPQTAEVINILKINKTPFIVALNKVDNISGWQKGNGSIKETIDKQAVKVRQEFDEKIMTLMGALHSHGFDAEPYYDIKDFTKKVALVPCSGKTEEGIDELIMTLCGLSQKFLKGKIKLGKEAKGVVLEIKKEKNIQYIEAILYDGTLTSKDEIAIASFDKTIKGKIRILEEVLPVSSKFKATDEAGAATGIRMQLKENVEVLPGMPFQAIKGNLKEIEKEFKKQVTEKIKTDDEGIIIKADSLGSLEALMELLRQAKVKVCKAGIGSIDKKDVISANTNYKNDPTQAVVLGFNVSHEEDIKDLNLKNIKIIEDEVVYKIIEQLEEFQEEKRKEVEKARLTELASICKLTILHDYIFHNSNPAIFGVKVESGKLKDGTHLINAQGKDIANVKKVQADKKAVEEATQGMEVAISLPGVNFDRQLTDEKELYSDLSEGQFKKFKENKDLLSSEEVAVLQKIAQIKRKEKPTWGV